MPLSADEFLDRLELTGLLEEKMLAILRRQVAQSKTTVTAETLAERLVATGQLTASQAKKFAGEEEALPGPGPAQESAIPPKKSVPPQTPPTKASPAKPTPAPSTPASPAARPNSPPSSKEDELWLAPSEDFVIEPPPKPKGQHEEPAEIVDLIEVAESSPAQTPKPASAPAKQPAPKPAPPPAAPPPPTPSAPTSHLTPQSGLTPLPSGGLTPLSSSDLFALDASSGLSPLPDLAAPPRNLTPGAPVDLFAAPARGSGSPSGSAVAAPYGQGGQAAPGMSAVPGIPAKKIRRHGWDSPFILLGGGALVLLMLAGLFIYWVLTRGSADELFEQAEKDYRGQSYAAAQANYEKFLRNFPQDGKASLARVRRGMSRIRPLVEAKDWKRGLEEAKKVLPEIESEAQFNEARTELATLLPDIAAGFAARAKDQADTAKSQGFVDLAEEALALVNNSSYIPTTMRAQVAIEPRIQRIQEDVSLARRDINRDLELAKALAEIDAAVKEKKTAEAYAIRSRLVKAYPDLEVNADLHRKVLFITENEREQVKAAEPSLAPSAEDEPARDEFRVVLAATNGPGIQGVQGRVVVALARGAVYALDAASGRILWRRFVGFETKAPPQLLSKQPGSDALLVDGRRNELVRVNAATGKLVWRLAVGEPFAGPVVAHDRIFITTSAGRVIQVEPQSGRASREARFPQPLAVEPGSDARGRVVYQVGEHSNVYVLKVDTLGCESVFYTGHKAGSVVVPPMLAQGFLFVAENAGSDYCLLHVVAADSGDAVMREAQDPLRLKGRVLAPLAISSRRVLVVTDLGEISLLEIDAANARQPVTAVVRFGPTTKERVLGYPLADEGLLWVADRRVAKYEIQTTRSELVRKSIRDDGDTFIGPLERVGDAVIQIRQRRNSKGVSITAAQVDTDQALWQTDLATPLAGPVQVEAARKRLLAISAYAEFYGVDQPALQAGLASNPATVIGTNSPGLTFTRLIELDTGKIMLTSAVDNERAVAYDPASDVPLRMVKLAFPPGTAVGAPQLFRGGVLQPSNQGRVYLLDPRTGGNLVLPFQPRLAAGETIAFNRPAIVGPDKNEFVVGDGRKRLYRVGVKDQPQPFLAELAQTEAAAEIVSPLAAVGNTLYAVTQSGAADVLASFSLPDLKPGKETPLTGRVTFGPETVTSVTGGASEVVFVATDREGLLCLEAGEVPRWITPLPYGPLAGRPLVDGADFILASQSGVVWRVAADTGKETARLDIGEPLGAGPVLYGQRLLLAGSDGVLHVVKLPAAAP